MSTLAAAVARPLRRGVERIRHLEVAPTSAQRRARPRLVYAVIVVGGIGAILLAQLLLSIATADGAYRISALETQQRDFTRQQAALAEKLDVLRSTQNLTRDAEALGMVASGNPVFLDVSTGAVSGSPTAAGGTLTGSGNLIGNALLSGSAIDRDAVAAQKAAADQAARDAQGADQGGGGIATPGTTDPGAATDPGAQGAPQSSTPPASVPSAPTAPPANGVLSSPVTH